jgi:hypothetical protein
MSVRTRTPVEYGTIDGGSLRHTAHEGAGRPLRRARTLRRC